ncbi:MAG: hypothetical protein ACKO7W_19160 [Elainella sp.]
MQHPLEHGQTFRSPGCHFTYRVIGPCCRLFDREELPWPCCRLQWRGKEPSWRRIGKRYVPDLATKQSPSYSVEVVGQEYAGRTFVVTLYAVKLPQSLREWWHSKKPQPELPPSDAARDVARDAAASSETDANSLESASQRPAPIEQDLRLRTVSRS